MKNLKKLAAGSVIALVIGASAIAGPMSAGSASADGHVVDASDFIGWTGDSVTFQYTIDSDTAAVLKVPGRLKWENVVLSGP